MSEYNRVEIIYPKRKFEIYRPNSGINGLSSSSCARLLELSIPETQTSIFEMGIPLTNNKKSGR